MTTGLWMPAERADEAEGFEAGIAKPGPHRIEGLVAPIL
jgi:hypothetical protein